MSFSINTVTSDGAETQFPISFTNGIYDRNNVKVYVQDDVDGTGNPLERSFTWINDGIIELDVAAPIGKTVTIQRVMNKNEPDVNYVDGAILDESNLNQSLDQLLAIQHEVLDGVGIKAFNQDIDMNGYKLTNLGQGTQNTDGVNLAQLNSAISGAGPNPSTRQYENQQGSDATGATFTLIGMTYVVGTNDLLVEYNGQVLIVDKDYIELSTTEVQMLVLFDAVDEFVFRSSLLTSIGATNTGAITHLEDGSTYNLQSYLTKDFDSFADAVSSTGTSKVRTTQGYYSTDLGVGASTYIKTTTTGTVGETDGGSYFIGTDGYRWELLHDGTVYIEQFGVKEGTAAGDAVRTACNVTTVKEVKTNLPTAIFDKIVYIDRNYITVDLSGCTVSWIGDYDVYAEFGGLDLDNSRNIGIFHAAGSLTGSEETTTTSIVDGTRVLDVVDGTAYSEGQFVCLKIKYPRRAPFVRVVARVVEVVGNALTLDYTFGWTATSCTIQPVDVRSNITVKGFNYVDNSGALDGVLENKVAGVGYRYAYNCHAVDITGENYSYPLTITKFVHSCNQINPKGIRPRFTDAGQGYTTQINEGIFCETVNPVGEQVRHIIDYTGGGHNKVVGGRAIRTTLTSQYSFHGMYEHDITVKDCTQVKGDNSIAVADSGAAFGEACKRLTIDGGHFSGRVKSQNATDFTIKNVEFLYGGYSTNEIELGCNGTLRVEDTKFPYGTLVRARPRATNPETIGDIHMSRSLLPEEFRFTFHTGRVFIDDSEITGLAVSSAPHSKSLKVTGGKVTLEGSWRVTTDESITFDGVDIVQASGTSDKRIVCEAPSISGTDCTFYNGAGMFGSGSVVDTFLLDGVNAIMPDASATSSQFSLDDTTNARMIVNGCVVMADAGAVGSSNTLDPTGPAITNANASITIANSYIEGDVRIDTGFVKDVKINGSKFRDTELCNTVTKSITSTAYTMTAGDEGSLLVFTNTSAAVLTMPTGLPIGFQFRFCKPTTTGNLTSVKPGGETEVGGTIAITATATAADYAIKTATKITSALWQITESV